MKCMIVKYIIIKNKIFRNISVVVLLVIYVKLRNAAFRLNSKCYKTSSSNLEEEHFQKDIMGVLPYLNSVLHELCLTSHKLYGQFLLRETVLLKLLWCLARTRTWGISPLIFSSLRNLKPEEREVWVGM